MATERPPTLAETAAARWARVAPPHSPWLHEEVARRMAERLEWIRLQPTAWAHWEPVRGGLEAHAAIVARYPQADCWIVEPESARLQAAQAALGKPWWRRIGGPSLHFGEPPAGGVQMVWANMQLHLVADPQALLARWQQALAVDGFLMFSCLGPDTLRELRALYAAQGWATPSHEFTDMHDWGDMLVAGGFAEPVMDMEQLTLTWDSPQRLLEELAGLGRNLGLGRFPALRGRGWRPRLLAALEGLRGPDGRLALTFEIIYGHALRAAPRMRVGEESAVGLDDMRRMLRSGRP